MCDPLTATVAASTVLQIGGAVAGDVAQNKQAKANKAAALDALKIKDHELSLQEVQERIAGNQQIEQGNRQVSDATGDVNTSASARGVSGMTVDLLLQDIQRQGSTYRDSVTQQTEANVAQSEAEKAGALAEAKSRIASVPPANPFATGLKIAGYGLDFARYKIGNTPKGT